MTVKLAEQNGAEQDNQKATTELNKTSMDPPAVQDLNSYINRELARHFDSPARHDHYSKQDGEPSSSVSEDQPPPLSSSKYAESLGRTDKCTPDADKSKARPKGARIFSKTKIDDPPPVSEPGPKYRGMADGAA